MSDNRRILVVDDEKEALDGYHSFLAPGEGSDKKTKRTSSRVAPISAGSIAIEPYEVISAESGDEAIDLFAAELAEGRRIAAAFVDVKMPGKTDGLQCILKLKELDPDIRCVVVTAYHDRTVEEIHKLFGEDFKDHWDFLNKPFTHGEIVQKARQMVGAWNRERMIEEMQVQLVKSERLSAVGQVARGVGHEFSNILVRLMGKIDLSLANLKSAEPNHEKLREHLNVAMDACERAGILSRNLQTFAKSDPKTEETPLHVPVESALALVNHDLVNASVKLDRMISAPPIVTVDSRAIGQVLLNLFINAIYAMETDGGTLSVSVRTEGKYGVIEVGDTGGGIPEELLPRIFEVAFSTKGDKGSGLGLSIARDIVQSHKGELTVANKKDGALFTIRIPAT